MYIHEGEEEDTEDEEQVDEGENAFNLFEIDEDGKYFTKTLKQNTL